MSTFWCKNCASGNFVCVGIGRVCNLFGKFTLQVEYSLVKISKIHKVSCASQDCKCYWPGNCLLGSCYIRGMCVWPYFAQPVLTIEIFFYVYCLQNCILNCTRYVVAQLRPNCAILGSFYANRGRPSYIYGLIYCTIQNKGFCIWFITVFFTV